MKPYNALRLPTEADLSQCSIDDAVDILSKYFSENDLDSDGFKWELYVSIEADDLVRVIDLARVWNFRLQFKPKYEWDEWSLSRGIKGACDKVCVWSGGA